MAKHDDVRLIIDQLSEINHGMLGMAELLQEAKYERFACMIRVLALHADDHLGQLSCLWDEE